MEALRRNMGDDYNTQEALHFAVARLPEEAYALTNNDLTRCTMPNSDGYSTVVFLRRTFSIMTGGVGDFCLIFSPLFQGDICCMAGSLAGMTPVPAGSGSGNFYSSIAFGDYDATTLRWTRPIGMCARVMPTQNQQYLAGRLAALSCPVVSDSRTLTSVAAINAQPYPYTGQFAEGVHVVVPHLPRSVQVGCQPFENQFLAETIDRWIPSSNIGAGDTQRVATPFSYHWDPDVYQWYNANQDMGSLVNGWTVLRFPKIAQSSETGSPQSYDICLGTQVVPNCVITADGISNDTGLVPANTTVAELTIVRVDEHMYEGTLMQQKPVTHMQPPVPVKARPLQAASSSITELVAAKASDYVTENWRGIVGGGLNLLGGGLDLAGEAGVPLAGLAGRGLQMLSSFF